jgi:hypothetical protein
VHLFCFTLQWLLAVLGSSMLVSGWTAAAAVSSSGLGAVEQARESGQNRFANLMVAPQMGLLSFTALELVLELEDGEAAAAAAVWGSSVQFGWLGQCGCLHHVLVSCFWAPTNFSILPAATPGANALLAMVVGLLGQLITGACFVAQPAHVLQWPRTVALCLVHVACCLTLCVAGGLLLL